ncbi:MAG TPA: hotdog fold thioesterase [Solirubrobacterales bacterium]|nr:hotdog fold thioesterase [Solirubrobacterales bacterium]
MTPTEVWREPVRGSYPDPGALALPGRERLAGWLRAGGPLPPLTHLTGARPTGIGDGTADAEMPASDWLVNSAGLIGGGTLAILADVAFGCSVETQLPAATPYTTAELSLTFLRPARPGATLTAHGQSIHVGRTVGLSEVFVIDPRGEKLIAHGTSRLAILPPLEQVPEPRGEAWASDSGDPGPGPFERPAPPGAVLGQEVWDELPGIEIIRRQIAGDLPLPPICHLTGAELTAAGEGEATMRMPATEWLNSPVARLQGGTLAMLADMTMGCAAVTTAAPGTAIAGLDLKVNYLRPVLADGRDLVARATLVHSGRTLAISQARIENADGKPVALATGTAMHLPDCPVTLGADVELASEASPGAAAGR